MKTDKRVEEMKNVDEMIQEARDFANKAIHKKGLDYVVEQIYEEAYEQGHATGVIIGNKLDEAYYKNKHHQDLIDEIVRKIEGMKKERNFSKDGAGVIIVDVYNQAIDDIIKNLTKE